MGITVPLAHTAVPPDVQPQEPAQEFLGPHLGCRPSLDLEPRYGNGANRGGVGS